MNNRNLLFSVTIFFSFGIQVVFSSKYEVLVDFTRDYDTIRQALYNVEHYDKVCVENMLRSAGAMLLSSWGSQNYNQVCE